MNQRRRVTNLGGECNSEQLKVFHHSRSCDMNSRRSLVILLAIG